MPKFKRSEVKEIFDAITIFGYDLLEFDIDMQVINTGSQSYIFKNIDTGHWFRVTKDKSDKHYLSSDLVFEFENIRFKQKNTGSIINTIMAISSVLSSLRKETNIQDLFEEYKRLKSEAESKSFSPYAEWKESDTEGENILTNEQISILNSQLDKIKGLLIEKSKEAQSIPLSESDLEEFIDRRLEPIRQSAAKAPKRLLGPWIASLLINLISSVIYDVAIGKDFASVVLSLVFNSNDIGLNLPGTGLLN